MNRISKIACFVIFSALLTSGFPNFMMQEAHAAAATFSTLHTGDTAGDSTATTTLDLVFNQVVYVTGNAGASGADIDVQSTLSLNGGAGGAGIASAIVKEVDDIGSGGVVPTAAECTAAGASATVVITLDTALATDATPTIAYTNPGAGGTQIKTCSAAGIVEAVATFAAQTATDGLSPTLDSASITSTTTIDVTFSEDLDAATIVSADFTVTNPTRTISGVSESVGVVTLTLTTPLTPSDTPTITVVGTSGGIDDTSAADNTISSGSVTTTTTLSSGGGGGCNGDCEEPTLGVLPNGKRVVDEGFTYNGHSVDVERFFTPYPLITAQTGKQNTAVFKIYENRGPNNIAHFDFAFGLGKDQIISDSKAMIEVDFARDGTQAVNIVDPENALDNVSVTTDVVACSEGPTQCLEITIKHTFRESLDFDIVGTNVWDYSRQSWQNYYNHGIEVVGPSLNPVKQHDGVNQGHIYHLTEISKTTAVDEFGDAWTFQYGKWSKDFIKQERIQDGQKLVFDRMHSDFASYKENLANEAFSQLAEMCPLCIEEYADFDVATSLEYGNKISKLTNPEIQKIMNLENKKAQEILKYIMDPKLSSSEKYHASIEKDERPISEILAEERMLSQYLQDEHYWLKQIIAPHN